MSVHAGQCESYPRPASDGPTCSHKMAAVARMSSFRSVSCFSLDMRPTPNLDRMFSACKDAILGLVSAQRRCCSGIARKLPRALRTQVTTHKGTLFRHASPSL